MAVNCNLNNETVLWDLYRVLTIYAADSLVGVTKDDLIDLAPRKACNKIIHADTLFIAQTITRSA